MTVEEFSNEFDNQLQAYIGALPFGEQSKLSFDEYEKSVFLTRAQEMLVVELYTGKNLYNDSFEKTEELRRTLGNLVVDSSGVESFEGEGKISNNSKVFKLPPDVWYLIYEEVQLEDSKLSCGSSKIIEVIPVTHDEYHRVKDNPFRRASQKRALRLDLGTNKVEIISKYNINTYKFRYLKQPAPIVLTTFKEGTVTINGEFEKTECELSSLLHESILLKAVQLAIASRTTTQTNKNQN